MKLKKREIDNSPNHVVISDIVLRELKALAHAKSRVDEVPKYAKDALDTIDDLFASSEPHPYEPELNQELMEEFPDVDLERPKYGKNNTFIEFIENEARVIFVEPNLEDFKKLGIPNYRNSDILIHQAVEFAKAHRDDEVIFLSLKSGTRINAKQAGLTIQNFEYESIADPNQIYPGFTEHNIGPLPDQYKTAIYNHKPFRLSKKQCTDMIHRLPKPNQVLEFIDEGTQKTHYYIAKPTTRSVLLKPVTAQEEIVQGASSNDTPKPKPVFDIESLDPADAKKLMTGLIAKHSDSGNFTRKKRKAMNGKLQNTDMTNPESLRRSYKLVCDTIGGPPQPQTIDNILQKKGASGMPVKFNINLRMNPDFRPVHEQAPFLELLLDQSIGLVTVNGPAGTGKSMITMYAGLMQIMKADTPYENIMYLKPLIEAGQKMGYLPGGKEDKLAPWMTSAMDSLSYIFCDRGNPDKKYKAKVKSEISKMIQQGYINFESITHAAGITLPNTYIMVDEAQLFNRKQIKLLVGRVGLGSKIVLMGDFNQIETSRGYNYDITQSTSGLAHVIENLVDRKDTAHIYLPKRCIMRSSIAEYAELI